MTSSSPTTATDAPPFRYTAQLADALEQRWQQWWDEHETFRVANPGDPDFDGTAPKFYCLDMFPYPSGAGLHVGHPEGYTATDIICRYKRLLGFRVLHPMGWDAFGLPAEQYAIQTGVHPAETTRTAIDNFRRQLKRFGFSYDWAREFATIDPEYYRWTQWIFLQAYNAWYDRDAQQARPIQTLIDALERGDAPISLDAPWTSMSADERRTCINDQRLAYLAEQTVNWCPQLGTVLANEEVIDGRSERGGYPVLRKPLKQWMFRITAFADRLLADLDHVKWPDSTRTMQAEWIGRSEGAEIVFQLAEAHGDVDSLRVFTTRPDTVFGATFMVVAPEHPLVDALLNGDAGADVRDYVLAARNRSDIERMESKEKTGVALGVDAINPANGERIAVWVADYVLMGYGHGAIMAVPAGDDRDFEFAVEFNLPVVPVVRPDDEWLRTNAPDGVPTDDADAMCAAYITDAKSFGAAFTAVGVAMNSANDAVSLDGLDTPNAKRTIIDWLESTHQGERTVNYRLRDWLFSRQRYWGEPFPIVYDAEGNHYPIDDSALPVTLPDLADYKPAVSDDPAPLLAKATDWVSLTAGEAGVDADVLPPDAPVTRETNTMPGWAGSCWYYLRYCDPHNDKYLIGPSVEREWMLSRKDGAPNTDTTFDPDVHHTGGVDLYVGGAEHAVLHLLYARFWHKMLFDLGHVSTPEPFGRLFHQGMITSYAYQRPDKSLVPVDEVDERGEESFVERATGEAVTQVVAKMSKSLKNVINPDDVIAEYGADTFRLYEMYMGPLEATKPWNTRDIIGNYRFLQRAWRLVIDEDSGDLTLSDTPNEDTEKLLHRTIDKVGTDIERLAFNTAIAALIEFVNHATSSGGLTADQLERFAIVLSPFAPHMGEELWAKLGRAAPIAHTSWPTVDPAMLVDDEIVMPVQIMGKVRGKINVSADADAATIEKLALADEQISGQLEGKTVRKVIVVPGKIVNIVAN
ncbi:MAG: leucine--tRNA ligase [Planctomycetota bacterium]